MEIIEMFDIKERGQVCESILRKLPDWFSIEKSIKDYIKQSKNLNYTMLGALLNGKYVGFVFSCEVKPNVIEVICMGVIPDYHRQGIGKKLMEKLFSMYNNYIFILKTLDKCNNDEKDYAKTRTFYKKLGFIELITIKNLWDKNNPCLIMIKEISNK